MIERRILLELHDFQTSNGLQINNVPTHKTLMGRNEKQAVVKGWSTNGKADWIPLHELFPRDEDTASKAKESPAL